MTSQEKKKFLIGKSGSLGDELEEYTGTKQGAMMTSSRRYGDSFPEKAVVIDAETGERFVKLFHVGWTRMSV